mgnify:CR=1 FL=1
MKHIFIINPTAGKSDSRQRIYDMADNGPHLRLAVSLTTANEDLRKELETLSNFYIKNDNEKYKKGDLLLIKDSYNYYLNDEVIFYESEYDYTKIGYGKISNVNQLNDIDTIYTINDDFISKNSTIGSVKNITKISFYGLIFSFAITKIGYMILVVIPFLVIFVYEIIEIAKEIKKKSN